MQLTNERIATADGIKTVRSPLRYPGGKQKAIEQIAERLPRKATEYREPMVGGGSVFFHARKVGLAKSYWINDKFAELFEFWRTVQDPVQCRRMVEELAALRASFPDTQATKEYFLRARSEVTQDPFRVALLFFFFNRVTFSGTTRAGGFSSSASERRFTASSIERLKQMPMVLEGVKITNDDFEEVIRCPGKNVFLFLDPPYFTATRLYGRDGGLHQFDHERLAATLKRSHHKFLITYDDCDEIRKLYSWARIDNWNLQYGMNNCNREHRSKLGAELFIYNYSR